MQRSFARRWSAVGKVDYFALNKIILQCTSPKAIEGLVTSNPIMNYVNVANAYRVTMKTRSINTATYRILEALSTPISFPARDLSSILHSIASNRQFTEMPPLFVGKLEEANVATFPPQSISNTLWALAKMNCKHDAIFQKFAVEIEKRDLQQFNEQDFANILWAFATVGFKRDALFSRFAQDLMTRNISIAKPQAISNIVWACATLGYKNDAMFAHVAQHLMTRELFIFDPQAIANIMWACATLDYNNDVLFARFAQHLITRDLSTFMPQDIANIVWACATLGYKNDVLFTRFAQHLMTCDLSIFTPQNISNIVWACATLGYKHDTIFARFAQHLMIHDFSTPQTISNILWAFATLRMNAPTMFQCFADAVLSNPRIAVSKMNTQEMSNLLYACALVNYRNDALLNELAQELVSREGLLPQVICNSMWAFACLDALDLKEVKRRFSIPTNQQHGEKFAAVDAKQLFQVKLAWQQTHGEPFPALIESLCKGDWIDTMLHARNQKEPESSRVHLRIAKLLERRFTLQNEAQVLGGVSVDILIPAHNAVVEVDGPYHFFSNQPDVQIGATVFKHRLLERAGFKVISVPVHQFYKADAEQYIKELEKRITK